MQDFLARDDRSPGAGGGTGSCLLVSLPFSLYINTTTSYNRVYGALAGAAVFMLHLYYSSFILLVGAKVNQIIEEHAPGGRDKGEKVPGQYQSQNGNQGPHLVRGTRPGESGATGSHPWQPALKG